jgi:hypothetical protein
VSEKVRTVAELQREDTEGHRENIKGNGEKGTRKEKQKARIKDGINKEILVSNCCCSANINSGISQINEFEPF